MANQLKMAMIQALLALHARGWWQRRIARELEINRGTVARYLQLAEQSKPAISLGFDPGEQSQNQPFRSPARSRHQVGHAALPRHGAARSARAGYADGAGRSGWVNCADFAALPPAGGEGGPSPATQETSLKLCAHLDGHYLPA